ncbi:hypothetical protein DEU56DRAFT_908311 [Suillus clintonianus]|uniref:uncharacterized protein n=1 Tax=Suillus clintonianus TaxID=1904413 RepID=UPI001B884FCF|nr:uncharacterized protein DEU56DRAFT_908311 [Suillus clintonianus]KAG2151463.1 hypothetical protein DEU56DRAFT_908311 [Suillus clintonianus]
MSSPRSTENPPKDDPEAPRPPSKVVEPTKVDTAPQQASTSPGDGSHIPADQIRDPSEVDRNDPNINVVEIPGEKLPHPSFKEQVFGYAKVIRGTALGKADVKEKGEQVLRGEETVPKRRGSTSN